MVQRVLLQKTAGIGAADRQAGLNPVVRPEDVGFIDPKIQKCVDGDRSRTVQQGVETDGFYPLRFERPEHIHGEMCGGHNAVGANGKDLALDILCAAVRDLLFQRIGDGKPLYRNEILCIRGGQLFGRSGSRDRTRRLRGQLRF